MEHTEILMQQLGDPRRRYGSHEDRRSADGLIELLRGMTDLDEWDHEFVVTIIGCANRLLARSSLLN